MSNYTQEQTDYMVEVYSKNPNRETVEEIAEELDRSIKSIIGKLSREGVYRREKYVTKTGENPITKAELIIMLANLLQIEDYHLSGLEKAPKPVLKKLKEIVEKLV
tara:strand:+ start:592 stop:909 length:318 start_codon:yes stop_codon:yes gene_type:complete